MSGRTIETKDYQRFSGYLLADVLTDLGVLLKTLRPGTELWEILHGIITDLRTVRDDTSVLVIGEIEGRITDFRPRQGKKLQRWKITEWCAQKLELYNDMVESRMSEIGAKIEEIEGLDEDDGSSLQEQMQRMEVLNADYDHCAVWTNNMTGVIDRIRDVKFPTWNFGKG